MSLSNIQAAVIAAVTQIVALIVAFGVVNSQTAGVLIAACVSVVNAGFLVANSIENHGKTTAGK